MGLELCQGSYADLRLAVNQTNALRGYIAGTQADFDAVSLADAINGLVDDQTDLPDYGLSPLRSGYDMWVCPAAAQYPDTKSLGSIL